jgi:DNA-directed RNA polymerase sigma subunit (sigma70/sigma32)
MSLMDPRDRQIRDAKIAIDAEQGLTLQQLSVKWQLTQQRISQILNRQAAA